jgi:hypothetical protein
MFSRATFVTAIALLLWPVSASWAQVFRTDDPILVDRDDRGIPVPTRRKINDYYDFFENTFGNVGDHQRQRALNINTLGEVPNSSWFTNRIGVGTMSRAELLQGSNRGPDPAPPFTVIGGKTQGITPGFTIRDIRGGTYFVKFDPATNPEMATAAEMISSKFFHALGYNTAEYYLIRFRPSELVIAPDAKIGNELGEEIPLTLAFVESVLSTVARGPDGVIRAIAAERIPGATLGPFKFYGTRGDDPNDIFPHEHRRELRGYYVLSSWLNHDDSRSINTYDSYVGDPGKGSVKHYLLDFGSTLGSASTIPQKLRPGNEYMWEAGPTFARMFSFGVWLPRWVSVPFPNYPSIGRLEADYFQPEKWKPEYPNVAFDNMDPEDAFWATRLVMMFRDEDIRAVLPVGQISDKGAEAYLADVLIKRRDKIGNYWLRQVSSLDGFRVDNQALQFEDLLVKYGFEKEMREHRVRFESFNNQNSARTDLGGSVTVRQGRVTLPAPITTAANNTFFVVTLEADRHAAEVFLKRSDGTLRVVGIQRR